VAYRGKKIMIVQLRLLLFLFFNAENLTLFFFHKMPLIILSGYPSSGKTQRVNEIKEYFIKRLEEENKSFRIHVINDESLHVSKDAYKGKKKAPNCQWRTKQFKPLIDAREEKKARGALLSAVERTLSKDDIVIADALNYIKGFRYQLYCIARAIGTPHCVVQTGVPIDMAKSWNQSRGSDGYEETMYVYIIKD
jgi:protein KTI12